MMYFAGRWVHRAAILGVVLCGLSVRAQLLEGDAQEMTVGDAPWVKQQQMAPVAVMPQRESEHDRTVMSTAAPPTASPAQAAKFGFVNLRQVMSSIPQLSSLNDQLKAEFAQQEQVLQDERKGIQRLEVELSKLSRGEAYTQLESRLLAKRREYSRMEDGFRDAYNIRKNEELAKLQQLVGEEITALARAQGYDMIIYDIAVVFVSDRVDLTDAVIQRLGERSLRSEVSE